MRVERPQGKITLTRSVGDQAEKSRVGNQQKRQGTGRGGTKPGLPRTKTWGKQEKNIKK